MYSHIFLDNEGKPLNIYVEIDGEGEVRISGVGVKKVKIMKGREKEVEVKL